MMQSASPSPPAPPRAAPFARVNVVDGFDAVRPAWAALAALARVTPYQNLAFLEAWHGAAGGASPFFVRADDAEGRAVALLPLGLWRHGPFRVAGFLGGKHVNLNLAPFADPDAWRREDVLAMLRQAGAGRIDLFQFANMPAAWAGVGNPLARLEVNAAPSSAFSTILTPDFATWFETQFSKDSRKKWRKKRAALERIGALRLERATDTAGAQAILAAFQAHRAARALDGSPNAYGDPAALAFLRKAAGVGTEPFAPSLALWALRCGPAIVATFGGLEDGGHISGVVTSFDRGEPFARHSPGELLIHDILADAFKRGVSGFDLGAGDGRYKRETCEVELPLLEALVPVSAVGAALALAAKVASQAKRRFKASTAAMQLLKRLRGMAARGQAG